MNGASPSTNCSRITFFDQELAATPSCKKTTTCVSQQTFVSEYCVSQMCSDHCLKTTFSAASSASYRVLAIIAIYANDHQVWLH